jgi:hypothetical protein
VITKKKGLDEVRHLFVKRAFGEIAIEVNFFKVLKTSLSEHRLHSHLSLGYSQDD